METQTLENPTFDTQDEFNRKPIAENIIRLLTSSIHLSPMVIDGGWGTGKTKFCQKLIQLMQQQHPDYQPVYIDAFRSDHSGEPLLALLAEIIKACTPEDTGEQPSEQRKNITRKVAKAAGFVMKTVVQAAVGHVLKQNTDDLAEELQQIMNDDQEADSLAETVTDAAATIASHTIDATVEALLKEQIEAEKNLETLKACLKEFAEEKPLSCLSTSSTAAAPITPSICWKSSNMFLMLKMSKSCWLRTPNNCAQRLIIDMGWKWMRKNIWISF